MFEGISLPSFTEDDFKGEKNLKKVMEYLYQLSEQLRYALNNIGSDNLSGDLGDELVLLKKQLQSAADSVTDRVSRRKVIAAINDSPETGKVDQSRMNLDGITRDEAVPGMVSEVLETARLPYSHISGINADDDAIQLGTRAEGGEEVPVLRMPKLDVQDGNLQSVNVATLLGRIINAQDAAHITIADEMVGVMTLLVGALIADSIGVEELFASSASLGKITTAHLSSEFGRELSLQSNEAIQLLLTRVTGAEDALSGYKNEVAAYLRYTEENGLELGKTGELYINRIDNDSYQILKSGVVVMEIVQDTLRVPKVDAYKRITLGDGTTGTYTLSVSPTHLTLRCKE